MFNKNLTTDEMIKEFFDIRNSDLLTIKAKMQDYDFNKIFDKYLKKSNKSYIDKDGYRYYEIEVPGFTKDELNIEHVENVLKIKGKSKKNNNREIDIIIDASDITIEKVTLDLGILNIKCNILTKDKVKKIIIE